MEKDIKIIALGLLLSLAIGGVVGCSSSTKSKDLSYMQSGLADESDSLAYIIGINIAEQLIAMDSVVNVEVVCRAIVEHSKGTAVMSGEEARTQYLRNLLFVEPERRRGYEEKFLVDLVAGDRSFTRTRSGLTYNISQIGREALAPKGSNDWLTICYSISRVGGEVLVDSRSEEVALSDLPDGVAEAFKLIGPGGSIRAWVPSKLAYGESGDEELGVAPIETLYYELELIDVAKGEAIQRKKDLEEF